MANHPNTNYVEVINNVIPGNVIRIKKDCKRVIEKIRILTWRVKNQVKKLNRKGSRTQRDKYFGKLVETFHRSWRCNDC